MEEGEKGRNKPRGGRRKIERKLEREQDILDLRYGTRGRKIRLV